MTVGMTHNLHPSLVARDQYNMAGKCVYIPRIIGNVMVSPLVQLAVENIISLQ